MYACGLHTRQYKYEINKYNTIAFCPISVYYMYCQSIGQWEKYDDGGMHPYDPWLRPWAWNCCGAVHVSAYNCQSVTNAITVTARRTSCNNYTGRNCVRPSWSKPVFPRRVTVAGICHANQNHAHRLRSCCSADNQIPNDDNGHACPLLHSAAPKPFIPHSFKFQLSSISELRR